MSVVSRLNEMRIRLKLVETVSLVINCLINLIEWESIKHFRVPQGSSFGLFSFIMLMNDFEFQRSPLLRA